VGLETEHVELGDRREPRHAPALPDKLALVERDDESAERQVDRAGAQDELPVLGRH
jgi:hypothetical protein